MPAFNLTALKEEAYKDAFRLWAGNVPYTLDRNSLQMMNATFWGGKQNISQIKLLEKVLIAFNSVDWIKSVWVNFERDNDKVVGNFEWMELELVTQRPAVPIGKCLRVVIPQEIKESKINKLEIVMDKKIMNSLGVENVNIFFQDPNANIQFDLPSSKIKESVFQSGLKLKYNLKSRVSIKLAEDPRTACMDYKLFGQYENCRDEEMKDIFQSLIGCVPIWFTDQPGHCGQQKATERSIDIVYDLMTSIDAGSFLSECLPPCTSVQYFAEQRNTQAINDGMAIIYLYIDQNVPVARTSFVVDLFTLLNRLGGTIGICKEALWCILILVGLVESTSHGFKSFFCFTNSKPEEEFMSKKIIVMNN